MVIKQDEHGEYDTDAGSAEPVEGRCNAVLKFTMERYGEKRYCTQLPRSAWKPWESDFCKHHVAREKLMEQHEKNFKTGAYVKSYTDMFGYMKPHKRVLVINIFNSLINESTYEFDVYELEYDIDVSDEDWAEGDVATVMFPVPREKVTRAKYLWIAALEFIKMEAIEEQIFKDAMNRKEGMGAYEKAIGQREDGSVIMTVDEHHLNLPLSRIIKDHKDLLKLGGVNTDDATTDSVAETLAREWVMDVTPNEPEKEKTVDESDEDPFARFAPDAEEN